MKLKLKDEFVNSDVTISFTGKGGVWKYTLKEIKPTQYDTLYKNGFQYLFEEVVEEMPLFDEPTVNKKKTVIVKTNDKV